MVGPVIGALMRHLATSAADTVSYELDPVAVDARGRHAASLDSEIASMPTPVMRHLAPTNIAWELELVGNGVGWHRWLNVNTVAAVNDLDHDMEVQGEAPATNGHPPGFDVRQLVDVEDGFALPPPAVDLDDGTFMMPSGLLDHAAGTSAPVVANPPIHRGTPLGVPSLSSVSAGSPTASLEASDEASVGGHGCDRLSRQRFTLPAHVVKDELSFSASSAVQPLRVRPSGCQAVRVGRRRVAVRSRQVGSAHRRITACGRSR